MVIRRRLGIFRSEGLADPEPMRRCENQEIRAKTMLLKNNGFSDAEVRCRIAAMIFN
jgi:hypothetical protein